MDLAVRKMPKYKEIISLCSMGVDSVAATHYFFSKNYSKVRCDDKNPLLSMEHFNHGMREQNDKMEEMYNQYMCHPIIGFSGYPASKIKSLENYTEDSLRQARLELIKDRHNYKIFITAHHLDDATESYMMNVLRGKEGFLPIPFMTEVGTNLIVHPFLFTKKKDFREYAEKNNLMQFVVEDETNKVTKGSRRNFIRNEIMPLLEREKMGLDTIVKKKMHERLMLEIIKA